MTKDADYILSEDKSSLENAYGWSQFSKTKQNNKKFEHGKKRSQLYKPNTK